MKHRPFFVAAAALILMPALMWPTQAAGAPENPAADTSAAPAPAKTPEIIQAANRAYNAGDYPAAAAQYRAIIQAEPARATAYRNLARSYFWQSEYPEAVAYYDVYLRLEPSAGDAEQVQSERRLAASRAGDRIWRIPSAQAQALAALEAALENGHAYTPGAGGAWGIYRTLLRTGYAQPELAGLQRRLVKNLLTEFVGMLVPASGQPTPRLELDDWRVQLERLGAVKQLSDDPAILSMVEQRALLAQTAVALLTDQFERAKKLSVAAAEENPDMPFILWFQVRARVETGDYAGALASLDALTEQVASSHPDFLNYAAILRASILQRMGRGDDAADVYLGLLDGQMQPQRPAERRENPPTDVDAP